MLYSRHFYHGMHKKYSKIIGSIFSDIDVVREDENKEETHRLKVPVTYSAKEKYIRRIMEDPELKGKGGALNAMPMIGYELVSINYQPERKLSRFNRIIIDNGTGGDVKTVMQPVPYDFYYKVTAIAKTQTDLFQIMEQVIPFFSPDLVINMRGLSNPDLCYDVPVTLLNTQIDDSYDGEYDERRIITCEFNLLLKGFLFGPVREGGIIKQVNIQLTKILPPYIIKDIEITPYIDGVAVEDIGPTDDYGYSVVTTETI